MFELIRVSGDNSNPDKQLDVQNYEIFVEISATAAYDANQTTSFQFRSQLTEKNARKLLTQSFGKIKWLI